MIEQMRWFLSGAVLQVPVQTDLGGESYHLDHLQLTSVGRRVRCLLNMKIYKQCGGASGALTTRISRTRDSHEVNHYVVRLSHCQWKVWIRTDMVSVLEIWNVSSRPMKSFPSGQER